MTSESHLRAQARAVAVACECLAGVYRSPESEAPERFLEVTSEELWRFSQMGGQTSATGLSKAGIWVSLAISPWSGEPSMIGPVTYGRRPTRRQRTQLADIGRWALERLTQTRSVNGHGETAPALLEAVLDDGHGGTAAMIGGTLETDRNLAKRFTANPLVGTVFTALARAARERILVPAARRRVLLGKLTPVPRSLLPLVLDGLTTPEIGALTGRSTHTAHDHVQFIYRTLGVNSRRELVALWNGQTLPKPAREAPADVPPTARRGQPAASPPLSPVVTPSVRTARVARAARG